MEVLSEHARESDNYLRPSAAIPRQSKTRSEVAPDLRVQLPQLLLCSSTLVVLPVPRHKDLFYCARKPTGCKLQQQLSKVFAAC